MLRFTVLALLVGCAFAAPFRQELDGYWKIFKNVHNKQYDQDEEAVRRLIFEQNVERISHHNLRADLGMHSYKLGLNAYADLTHTEFKHELNGFRHTANSSNKATGHFVPTKGLKAPDTVDWRDKGIVTPVKDQQQTQCGSSWAFSATGSLEGQWALKTGQLLSLSEQNLVDCSGAEGNRGCKGGWMNLAFQYIIDAKGIDTEECYPYTAKDGNCNHKKECIGAWVVDIKHISSGDEDVLKMAVAEIGPISVAIDTSKISFQLYSSGVYDEPSCSQLVDHAVLAVGYGNQKGKDYWLVKNSWGKSWGQEGYILMSRNKQNQCGIANYCACPIV